MDAKRDWGFAKEYVEGMWRMLQADEPDTLCWRPTVRKPCATLYVWRPRRGVHRRVWKGKAEQERRSRRCHRQDRGARQSEVLPPRRSGIADRQSGEGQGQVGLGAEDDAGATCAR